ncbi:M-phase phosphoprotein 8 isoform X2 [Centropristis striata]|uniref:M-phase phosphoprotein 8 isoform X2 n=1 Tax=Centropristis striata TaxID=184440 RepID=UPI0027DFA1C9|nr:M-phase phosphoprotein 8 isoform X2 [Centropristis striata]
MAAEAEKVEPADSEQEEEVEDVYEVERIIDMRMEEGEVLYRVRWKNYCSDDDTWEPEAHLEDCREVLLAFKKSMAEIKAKKEAEAKKTVKILPTKSDVFDADSESESDKDRPADLPVKKKKKKKIREEDEEQPSKDKKKKKKDKRKDDVRPLPAPETDDDEEEEEEEETERVPTPPSPPKEKKTDTKKRVVDSDDEDDEPVPSKKHKKEKGKEGGKHRKEKGEEGKKKKGKKERKVETSDDEAAAPLEDDLSDSPSQSQMDDAASTDTVAKSAEKPRLEDKFKQKKGKWEVKLQGIKDLIHDKKNKKPEAPQKEISLQKLKNLTSKVKEDAAPHSDSSDSSTLHKKAKSKGQESKGQESKGQESKGQESKGQESTSAPPKVPSSSTSSSSSSSSVTAPSSAKVREEEVVAKEEALGPKDTSGSTNLFEKFLLNCEAKDRAPRRPPAVHQAPPEKVTPKPAKVIGKIEKTDKISKTTKDSPAQKQEPEKTEKTKQTDVSKPGQSYGFSLDSEEREAEESAAKQKPGEESRERKERSEEAQRPSWERKTPTEDRRKRREDSEPRLFMACDDNQDPPEGVDKSDKGQATLSLGMDLNLDWMTLDDFQKHLNGEDEILSGPPLSPSELRDAVKSGDYMAVKLALNSKEDYNLDQEACTIGETRSFEGERSLIEERSSSDAFRLTSNLDCATNDEGTPRVKENVPQDLDGPKDAENMPSFPASINNEQETLGEHEKAQKDGKDISESENTVCDSAIEQESQGKQEQEDKMSDETNGGLSSIMSLDFDNSNLTSNAEGLLQRNDDKIENTVTNISDEQRSPQKANDSSDEAGQSDDKDHGLSELGTKKIPKRRLRRCRKTLESKQPIRSSLRTCKKVLETTSGKVEEEKKEACKKHFCLYCKMAFTQLAKHLEKRHADETDVAHAIHFPKGSKVRQSLLDQIRNKGDYEHNCQVLKSGEGEIVTKKQVKNPSVSVRDFLPCQHCFAFYRKTDLWRHERSCKARKGDLKSSETAKRSTVHSAASRLLPMSEFLTGGCEEIIHIMHQDDVSRHIRNDPLICKYGNALSAKYEHDKSQFAYIAQKMRELGRFVVAVNELDKSVKYLHEICQPSRFELAVEGAKRASGFDPSSSKFKTASLVSKIGYSLKRAAEIAFGESRMTEDSETESEVKKFIQLLDTKWSDCFSRKALALSLKQEVKKVEVDKSTVTEDLIKLHRFITGEEEEARKELKESPNMSTWKKLSEATLADVCLFNRGRVGNIGRMLLKTYTCKKSRGTFIPSADQIRRSTKLELDLGASFTRLELEGQYGRNMLVLLTEKMVLSIDLLIENREQAGVSKTNPYLFARTEGPSFIRGLDCFRRSAMECGVKNPEALLSSSLREQIASCWQLMSLSEPELDQVAKLLGCSSQECYGLSKNASQLEEVSKQLLRMDRTLPSSPPSTAKDGAAQKPSLKRRPWSEREQAAVKSYLSEFIAGMKVPGKKECNACIAAEPDLCGRSWTDVKNYVHNTLQTVRRRSNQHKSEGNVNKSPKSPKAGDQNAEKALEDSSTVCSLTTVHPDHLTESPNCCMTMASTNYEMTSTYASLCSTSANMIMNSSPPLISTFTPLNATDTQVVPTFTPHNTTNALMPPPYTSENNLIMPLSPTYTQNATSMPPSSVYAPQDTTGSPLIPSFSTLTPPSTSMIPTFTPLNTSSPMVPPFSPLNDRSRPIVSSFTPLNTPVYPTGPPPPRALTTAQVVPTIHRPSVPDRTPVAQESMSAAGRQVASAAKAQKRSKRLWSEEEQAAVRRQLGDFCKLVKVPGKKDCDACLAAEPALNSRTWREVKYFVHNSIQSMKRRGHVVASKQSGVQEPETHNNPNTDWDGPVYLSL